MILNEYSKTAWIDGASPSMNKATLDNLEQGVYDVTAKAMELAAYETNAAASAVSAAASAAVYTDLAQDVTDLTTVVANHAKWSTTEEIVIGVYNGKPLYRKALLIPALGSVAGDTNYAHGIANVDIITIGNGSYFKQGALFLTVPFLYRIFTSSIGAFAGTTNVAVSVGSNQSTTSAVIFLEYTKTTD